MTDYAININTGRLIMTNTSLYKRLHKLGQVAAIPSPPVGIIGPSQRIPCTNARLLLVAQNKELIKAERGIPDQVEDVEQKPRVGRPQGTRPGEPVDKIMRHKVINFATDIINEHKEELKDLDQNDTNDLIKNLLYTKLSDVPKPKTKARVSKFKVIKSKIVTPSETETDDNY